MQRIRRNKCDGKESEEKEAPKKAAEEAPKKTVEEAPKTDVRTCRICLQAVNDEEELLEPCKCSGSIGKLHVECLKEWMKYRYSNKCEICQTKYTIKLKAVNHGKYCKFVQEDPETPPTIAILSVTGFYAWLLFKLDILSTKGIIDCLVDISTGNVTIMDTLLLTTGSICFVTWSSLFIHHFHRFRKWRMDKVTYELILD